MLVVFVPIRWCLVSCLDVRDSWACEMKERRFWSWIKVVKNTCRNRPRWQTPSVTTTLTTSLPAYQPMPTNYCSVLGVDITKRGLTLRPWLCSAFGCACWLHTSHVSWFPAGQLLLPQAPTSTLLSTIHGFPPWNLMTWTHPFPRLSPSYPNLVMHTCLGFISELSWAVPAHPILIPSPIVTPFDTIRSSSRVAVVHPGLKQCTAWTPLDISLDFICYFLPLQYYHALWAIKSFLIKYQLAVNPWAPQQDSKLIPELLWCCEQLLW